LRVLPQAALVLVLVAVAYGQGGPPLITDDPGTPGNRHWEINVGFTGEILAHEKDFETPILDVNYGDGDHVQLKYEVPFATHSSAGAVRAGLGNSKIGMKWRWVDEEKHGFGLSTYPQFTFNNPTGSVRRGLADSGWQMFLPIEIAKTAGRLEWDGEAGYNVQQRRSNETWLGSIFGWRARKRLEFLVELHSIGAPRFHENESVFDLGTRAQISKLSTLLLAAGRSLPGSTANQPGFFFYSGIQFAF
jgi:hypothetical protein